jgi:hypothetical protein
MLNELHKLSRVLESFEIKPPVAWHRQYNELPNGNCYKIFLDGDGNVSEIDKLDKGVAKSCRKYGNNQRSFPAFNIAPLFRASEAAITKKEMDDAIKGKTAISPGKLVSLCETDNWTRKSRQKIDKRLHVSRRSR